jgi:hypothetical protein
MFKNNMYIIKYSNDNKIILKNMHIFENIFFNKIIGKYIQYL